jgi:hypothetical protein
MRDKHLRECGLVIKNPLDFRLCHSHRLAFRHCRGCRQAFRLSNQASFAHKFVWSQERDDGFLALLGYDGDFDLALPDIENRIRILALGKMTSFFECVEMTRPWAVVSKNTAGLNRASLAALRFVRRLAGLDLGA